MRNTLSSDYIRGFRAAIRYLITTADALGPGLKKAKLITKKTAEWLKIVNEFACDIADGYDIELWQTPDKKLFGKRIAFDRIAKEIK